jgi:hypothetical protein
MHLGAQLYKASKKGHVEAVKKLLARNVDVNETFEVRGRVWAP